MVRARLEIVDVGGTWPRALRQMKYEGCREVDEALVKVTTEMVARSGRGTVNM